MQWWEIALLAAAGAVVNFVILPNIVIAAGIYIVTLVRQRKDKWQRGPSMDEPIYMEMFRQGQVWREQHLDAKIDVHIINEGLNLYGEYFDFGHKRAALILPGRMETCLYGCYFAETYRAAGYNVLTYDNRAHGLSDGKINSLGYKEYRDVLAWCRMLHDSYGIEEIVLHGICIGSSCALFAITAEDCPDYVKCMVADGMYTRFYDTFVTHLRELGHKPFFVPQTEAVILRIFSGADVVNDGPYKRITELKKPILFIHSKEDIFSLPEKTVKLAGDCTAPKRFVWFEHGYHSKLRIVDPEFYDESVKSFLTEVAGL
ncbi:MAG: alpha/beta fold hydrolase [Lachnospiraceae bacterium]|nr:alpha/beta fold hydrolase [Lachnospiraceae bacterium]